MRKNKERKKRKMNEWMRQRKNWRKRVRKTEKMKEGKGGKEEGSKEEILKD